MIVGEWVVASLAFRKCRKTYPWFTALVCFMAVKSLYLLYVKTNDESAYFYPYYRTEAIVSFLQLGATVEVFGTLFRPFWTVPKGSFVTLVLSTSFALAIVARWNAELFSPYGEIAFYQSMDRLVSCSTGIALSAVLLFARHFEMPFRSRVKGISAGLYIMAVTSITMALTLSKLGNSAHNSLAFVPLLAHYCALTIWTYYIAQKETLVAVIGRCELKEVHNLLNQFRLALSYTPTSCGLTLRKKQEHGCSEEKAKMVNSR
jgi:hypothetical protein